jgi:hypothetical protein
LDADYALEININTNLQETADDIENQMSTLTTALGKVGENYVIAASDVSTFAASFPELAAQALDSVNQVGDGSLTVNAAIL